MRTQIYKNLLRNFAQQIFIDSISIGKTGFNQKVSMPDLPKKTAQKSLKRNF